MNTRYDGDLTFSISGGLDITIPNHQLVVPNIEINSQGQEILSNSSQAEILINSLQGVNTNDLPLFGLPFLSSAYLIVDNDKQQFTLSQSQQSTTSNLVAIGPPACNTPAPSPTPNTLPSVLASPSPTPKPSSGSTPTGAIVGAVVGGVVILAVCVGVFFIRKKRRVGRFTEMQRQEYVEADEPVIKTSELASDRLSPQEMPLDRDSGHGIPPYEMSAVPKTL